jgi:hypothetical protein
MQLSALLLEKTTDELSERPGKKVIPTSAAPDVDSSLPTVLGSPGVLRRSRHHRLGLLQRHCTPTARAEFAWRSLRRRQARSREHRPGQLPEASAPTQDIAASSNRVNGPR